MAAPAAAAPAAALPESERILARARAENFPVALRLLSREVRRHLLAIYGFARLVDELGDEAEGDRRALLDAADAELARAFRGEARHPLFRALSRSIEERNLPLEPFRALIAANRRDQESAGYASWEELADYCALSANPVGELVLRIFRAHTPQNASRSDAICTALQLVEHCQDVAEDYARGRVYLPAEELERFGCRRADLAADRAGPALQALLRFQVARVRQLLGRGAPLVAGLSGQARLAVAGFAAGGFAAADAVERCGFDVLGHRARPLRRDLLRHAARLWRGGSPA